MNGEPLHTMLRKAGRMTMMAQSACAAGIAVAAAVSVLILAVAADAILALSPPALLAVDVILGVTLVAALAYLARIAWRNRYDSRRLSRLVEERLSIKDSRLINAVDLAGQDGESFSRELAQEAVRSANDLARTLSPSHVVDWRKLWRAWTAGGIVLSVLAAGYLAMPGLFGAVIPRLLRPGDDLPPFTMIRFNVTIEPGQVHFGRRASIWAALSGPNLPDQANVVFVDGPKRQFVPMLRGDDGRFLLPIDRADQSRDFFIQTSSGRSGLYRLTVVPVPGFERATVQYDFPAYTRWPPSRAALDVSAPGAAGRQIRAIEGTQVTLTVKSNLPLGRGQITLLPAATAATTAPNGGRDVVVDMQLAGGDDTVTGTFPVTFSGRFQVRLWGSDGSTASVSPPSGTPCDQPLEGAITCNADAPPQVQITEPAMEVMAPEDWKIHVGVSASDDVAVDRIVLHPSINGMSPGEIKLEMTSSQPTFGTANHVFDLKALGARPGDVITYFATAYDNCPDVSHFTDSATFIIRVVSKDDYLAFARAQYRMEQVEQEVEEFRAEIKDLELEREALLKEFEALEQKIKSQDGRWTDADRKKLEDLDALHEQYARKEKELAGQMLRRAAQPVIYDFEQAYTETMRKMGEALYDRGEAADKTRQGLESIRVAQSLDANGQRYVSLAAEQLRQDAPAQEQVAQQVGQTGQDVQRLAAADQMVALVERITAITKQQRDLADRLGQFRNKESLSPVDQIRARRMADDQEQLAKELHETVESLEKLAQDNRQQLPNMCAGADKITTAIVALGVEDDQQDAARLAQAGEGRYAYQAAENAAEKLESLHSECAGRDGFIETASNELDGCLKLRKQSLAQSLNQLSEGRGIPGFGSGGEGGGFYGTRAQVTVMGPHVAGAGQSDAQSGRQGQGRGRGATGGNVPEERRANESLNPHGATTRSAGTVAVPGVPVKYRELAESYFRRIADESK